MNTQKSITQDFPSAPDVDQDSPQTPQAGSKTGGGDTFNPTPGPWFPNPGSTGAWEVNIDSGRYSHAVAYLGRGCPEFFQGDPGSNARLIAAAPEMMQFITSLVDAAGPHSDINGSSVISCAYQLLQKITGKEAA